MACMHVGRTDLSTKGAAQRWDCERKGDPGLRRWYSGNTPGTLTATSCGYTTGDPLVTVFTSANPTGGPFKCLG